MAKWIFEPGHSAAEFAVRHMMVSHMRGLFKNVHGSIDNDLLLGGRKVVGIRTEMTTTGQRIGHVAVGIGINVHQRREDFAEDVRESATSIDLAAGFRVDRGEVVAAVYNALDRWYTAVCADGPSIILQAARARTATLGKPVTVDTGEAQWQGTAVDLDEDGALLVVDSTVRSNASSLTMSRSGEGRIRETFCAFCAF